MTNLKAPAWKESRDPAFIYNRWATEAINKFNDDIVPGSPIAAIEEAETIPARIDDGLSPDSSIPSPDEDKLSKQWFTLIFGNQKTSLSDMQKNTPEWREQFTDFVNAIENLQGASKETNTDVIWRKCQWMAQSAMVAPAGSDRVRLMQRYVDLLNVSNLQPEQVSAWYGQIRSFLALSKAFSTSGPEATRVLQDNGNALIQLTARLDLLR